MTTHSNKPFSSFNDVEAYFNAHTNYERMRDFAYTREALDLDRVRFVLNELGNPENSAPIIHVAGTKGKGSTCALSSAILQCAGYRVGSFCQPHLVKINERVSINNIDIADDDWIACMNQLYAHLESMRMAGNPLTFFDIITVLAIYYFSQQKVDLMVIEVGLGGRLDSTNVVTPEVSVITTIDFDHMSILGDTLEKIAAEKAGIIKPGVPVVSGVRGEDARGVIAASAKQNNSELNQIDDQFSFSNNKNRTFNVCTPDYDYNELELNLWGAHQRDNAAVAICTAEILAGRLNFKLSESAVREGLRNVKLKGRVEVVGQNPTLILDVAHNPSSMRALREALQAKFPKARFDFLIGITADKDLRGCLKELMPVARSMTFTGTGSATGANADTLLQIATELHAQNDIEFNAEQNIHLAFQQFKKLVRKSDVGCITGSFYLAGEIAKLLQRVREM